MLGRDAANTNKVTVLTQQTFKPNPPVLDASMLPWDYHGSGQHFVLFIKKAERIINL